MQVSCRKMSEKKSTIRLGDFCNSSAYRHPYQHASQQQVSCQRSTAEMSPFPEQAPAA
jgi:hypothetical protein